MSACGRPKTFDQSLHRVTVAVAAAERVGPNPPVARRPSVAALPRATRLAFHRWVVAYWFHQWVVGLEAAEEAARRACGGDLPPCYVLDRESGGNPYAVNPGHAGAPYGDPGDPTTRASGLWQFMPSTWNGYAGYPYAAAAPATVQDAKAREVWAGGAGSGNWTCC